VGAEGQRYRFGPLEHRGLIGSLRAGQALVIGGALVAAVVALNLLPAGPNALAALVAVAAGGGVAFVPVQGRALEEWLPVVVAFWARRRSRGGVNLSGAPTAGARLPVGAATNDGPPDGRLALPEDPPPEVAKLELLEVPYGRSAVVGVMKDRRALTFTMPLRARVQSFGLLEGAEQERRLQAWGAVLAGLASERSAIRRVQWIERTVPSDGDELARYFSDERDQAVPLTSTAMGSYIALLEEAGPVTQDHEILIVLQLDGRRMWRAVRRTAQRGGARRPSRERLDLGAGELLLREGSTLAQRLETADVRVEGAMSPGMYARAIRDAYDPYGRVGRARLQTIDPDRDGLDAANAWPVAAREGWDRYHTDSGVHATYWISGWPRIDVGATFLSPLLMQTPVLRTVSVVLEPIAPSRSTREVEAAMTQDTAEEDFRARRGFRLTARRRQQHRATANREDELAAGHAELRMAGFVAASAVDDDALDRACGDVEHAAHQARLELARLYGQQPQAFTYTLPLCRGLR
jgi:hypothetical protein